MNQFPLRYISAHTHTFSPDLIKFKTFMFVNQASTTLSFFGARVSSGALAVRLCHCLLLMPETKMKPAQTKQSRLHVQTGNMTKDR